LFKNQNRNTLQKLQKKNRKEKQKEKRNRENGRGKQIGLEPKSAHGPAGLKPEPVSTPALSLTLTVDPHCQSSSTSGENHVRSNPSNNSLFLLLILAVPCSN
jgi:hypothetical protein